MQKEEAMAITKKKTTAKPAHRKIQKTNAPKSATPVKAAAPASRTTVKTGRIGIISWLFLPDLSLSGARLRWAGRAFIFTTLFLLMIVLTGAIGVQSQLASIGFTDMSFKDALDLTIMSILQFPGRAIVSMILIFILGAFMFMPRRLLSKDDAVAVNFTYFPWLIIAAFTMLLLSYFGIKESWAQIPILIIMLLSMTAIFSAVLLYARNFGVKKYVLLLTAPFGLGWFSWHVFFMPGMGKANAIDIRFGWYKKLINLALYTKYGQVIMAAVLIPTSLYFSSAPWDIATIAILAVMFVVKGGKWIMERFQKFSWLAVILNLVGVGIIAYIFYITPMEELMMRATF